MKSAMNLGLRLLRRGLLEGVAESLSQRPAQWLVCVRVQRPDGSNMASLNPVRVEMGRTVCVDNDVAQAFVRGENPVAIVLFGNKVVLPAESLGDDVKGDAGEGDLLPIGIVEIEIVSRGDLRNLVFLLRADS